MLIKLIACYIILACGNHPFVYSSAAEQNGIRNQFAGSKAEYVGYEIE